MECGQATSVIHVESTKYFLILEPTATPGYMLQRGMPRPAIVQQIFHLLGTFNNST